LVDLYRKSMNSNWIETHLEIRKIKVSDEQALAGIIRSALEEFDANKPGTVYFDESTDHLSTLFQTPNSVYYVALDHGQLLGGVGLYPTQGLPAGTIELVKMYLSPAARGKGLGKHLILKMIEEAKQMGFRTIYLETMHELSAAVSAYKRLGFELLSEPLGESGHHSCEIWMCLHLEIE
jgi:putative acetyltransferase